MESLQAIYAALPVGMRLLIEYKFFEPAFYSTDLPDWGTSLLMAQKLGPQAEVLVDTGHHPQGTNIAQLLVDRTALGQAQEENSVLGTYRVLQAAYETDVRPLLVETRIRRGLNPDPIAALQSSGYAERVARERAAVETRSGYPGA